MPVPIPRKSSLLFLALIFAMGFPSLMTAVYFLWLSDSQSLWQQLAFGIGKIFQFSFPVLLAWWCFQADTRRSDRPLEPQVGSSRQPEADPKRLQLANTKSLCGLGLAVGFGLLVGAAIFAIYARLLPEELSAQLQTRVLSKIESLGVSTPWRFMALAIFYTLCHSFLEEYYWRWFVFGGLRKYAADWLANVISSLGFMAHHVILLAVYLGWDSPLTWLFSASIAIGGMFWAWLYARQGTLMMSWFSHALVDAAIFGLGFWIVRDFI